MVIYCKAGVTTGARCNVKDHRLRKEMAIHSFFGPWFQNQSEENLLTTFQSAEPYKHLVIDDFFSDAIVNEVSHKFPAVSDVWHKYNNPIEVKYALNNIEILPDVLKQIFDVLSSTEVISKFKSITGIHDLEYDPFLHGAGLHAYPRDGRLHMHLDYEKHPHLERERRVNLIVYLSREWKSEYGGGL